MLISACSIRILVMGVFSNKILFTKVGINIKICAELSKSDIKSNIRRDFMWFFFS